MLLSFFHFPTEVIMIAYIIHWILIDSKSLQVSRTLLSILADHNNAEVWMVSILPLIFNFSSLLSKPLRTMRANYN